MRVFLLTVISCGCLSSAVQAVDFVRDVRPIFEKHCYACHGAAKQRSGYRLDVKSEALKGGDTFQPAIVPGKAADSPLLQVVSGQNPDMRMPPKGERLSSQEIAILRKWIDEGASWPDGVDRIKLADKRNHWSLQPVIDAKAPSLKSPWPKNDIDRFILARLEKESLTPSAETDRVSWLRRVTFDLTGLPPSPQQVADFVKDSRSDAFERVVDALLQSPRHGERWAQHWLDVVRYADTHGFEVNTERPNAWPYRDYVIAAFNDDTPYDRFIREQIIGDQLGKDAATGFLVTSSVLLPGQIGADEPSKRLARQDALDEIVINTGQTFLGLSIGCARCHDHKFDPISQRDYFAMQAFFAGVEYGDRAVHSTESERLKMDLAAMKARIVAIDRRLTQFEPIVGSGVQRAAVNARMNSERFAAQVAKRLKFTILTTNGKEPCLDELEAFNSAGENVALASAGGKATASGQNLVADRHELRFVNDGQYGNLRSWMGDKKEGAWIQVEFAKEQSIQRVLWSRDRDGKYSDRLPVEYRIEVAGDSGGWRTVADSKDRRKYVRGDKPAPYPIEGLKKEEQQEVEHLVAERRQLEDKIRLATNGQMIYAGIFRMPDTVRLLYRGDPEQPKDEVAPAVLGVLGSLALAKDASDGERRKKLADWIASPENPLTARVMVNRIWQGHFGVGLVETSSDFGHGGTKPSHPELLDWLASEFIRSGWSIKHLHRLIVLSATYRQSSQINAAGQDKDADVRFLWRYPSRRLEAEAVRDAMLAVSGRLVLTMGGRGFDLFDKRGGLTGFKPIEQFGEEGRRRMIYAHKVRREKDGIFGALDCPDNGQSTSRRRESTTPIQALNLFNGRFTWDEAQAFAARVKREAGDGIGDQMSLAFRLALSRSPTADELRDFESVVREHGLATLCRVLFNTNEFLFLP